MSANTLPSLPHQLVEAALDGSAGRWDEALRLLCEIVAREGALDQLVNLCDSDTRKRQAVWDALTMYLDLEGDVEQEPVAEGETAQLAHCRAVVAAIRHCVRVARSKVSQELLGWCDEAFAELDAGCLDEAEPDGLSLLLSAPRPGSDVLWVAVQAVFFAGDESPVRWASRRAQGGSPTWLSVALLGVADTVNFSAMPARAWPVPPLYRYHPERFKATRKYAKRLRGIHAYVAPPRERTLDTVTDLVGDEMVLRATEFDRRIAAEPAGRFKMWIRDIEVPLAITWANFVNAGRQIFELKPDLVELLRHTGAGDIRMNEIRLPYQVFYLRFGEQADWQLAPGWMVEGCYVEHHIQQQLMIFRFTCRPDRPDRAIEWAVRREPHISISMKGAMLLLDIESAIDTALAEHLGMIEAARVEVLANTDRPEFSRTRALDRLNAEEDEIRATLPIAHAAMHLVASALCFLTAYEDDIAPVWPDETPKALLTTLTTGTVKQKAKAQSQLEQMGYTQVRLCGARIRGQAPGVGCDPPSGVRTHWRRGHWRRQVHGEGRSLRKLIWLMPTLVNPGDPPDAGHIYLAGES